jgi:hypothetical protein
MLSNLPCRVTQPQMMTILDDLGFGDSYDLLYLPVGKPSSKSGTSNLGYGFVNFKTVEDAQLCFEVFEGFNDWKLPSDKVCTVEWSRPTQGLPANIEKYRNSPVMHHSLPEDWKPLLFKDGERIPFPEPTRSIKPPKVRPHTPPSNKSA